MPQPALSYDKAIEAVERVNTKLREGYRPQGMSGTGPGAIQESGVQAVREGVVNSVATFKSRLRIAKENFRLEPDESAYRPRQYLHRPPGAPVIPFQDHIAEPMPEGDPVVICVIGDAHDSPHLQNKERFQWLGQFAAEHQVERVVSVGDWMTLDSFSTHTDRATFEGLAKPTFTQDLDSFHESQQSFQNGLDGWKPKKDITLGNHEHRAWRWDNFHPEAEPHGFKIEEAFAQWGWRTTPYGQYRFIDGVGFVHVPLNGLGRPMAQGQRANKAMFDTIHGDDHRSLILTDYKTGPLRSPTVYGAATALPPGFIEGFANKGGSTWRSGVCLATIWGGYVRSWQFVEMSLLQHRYGARIAA